MRLRLDRPNRQFIGLYAKLHFPVAVEEILVLLLKHTDLLLQVLILRLQAIHLLLEVHVPQLDLQMLRQLRRRRLLRRQQVLDDHQHKVDQEDSRLDDVLFGLRQILDRVPPGPLQEEIVHAAVQFAVQLAQVLAAIALGDAVLLALVVAVAGYKVVLALAAAQLLQWGFAGDVSRRDQLHDLGARQFMRPAGREPLCCCCCRRRRQ